MALKYSSTSIVLAALVVAAGCGGRVEGSGGATGSGGSAASTGNGGGGVSNGSGGTGAGSGGGGAVRGGGGVGNGSGGTGAVTSTGRPPPPSNAPPNSGGTKIVIEVSHYYIGDTDRSGNPDPNAWKHYGYNLDGLVSTATDQNHCRPVSGANPRSVKTDGDGGIDNSFGENLLPLFMSLTPTLSKSINQWLAAGNGTGIIRLDHFIDPAQAPNQNGIGASLYEAAPKGSPALFNGGDVWPVTSESVSGGNIDAPRVVFPHSYVSGGLWVSGRGSNFVLKLDSTRFPLRLPLSRVVITARIKGSGKTASAVDGTIAGVMNTQTYIADLENYAPLIDPSLCNGPTFQSFAQQIRAASDIMSDGSNGDPSKTCDAISVGIGFSGFAAQIGSVVAVAQRAAACSTP